MDGNPPDLHVVAGLQIERWIVGIGRFQAQPAVMANQVLESEAAIENSHHHASGVGVKAAVHNQKVAVVNAVTGHGVAANTQEKGAGGMPDQLVVEVNPHVHVVLCWRREACGHSLSGQWQLPWCSLGA